MTTLNVKIPDTLETFIAAQAAIEGHDSASDYVVALVSRAKCEKERSSLEGALLEGVDSLDRGEGRPLTSEDWRRLRARLEAKYGPEELA